MSCNELFPLFKEIIKDFSLKGGLKDIEYIGTGNINDTYLVTTDVNGAERQYIFQRVNHRVFSNPEKIAENVCKVTEHIEKKMRELGVSDIRRRVMHYYRKSNGSYFYITETGDYWRALSYIYYSESVCSADIPHLRSAGMAFGDFQRYLSDFPADTLYVTIPDFHNTEKRFTDLKQAASLNIANRLDEVGEELNYLLSMEYVAPFFNNLNKNGEIPLRVVHNDTKCNNVMFDSKTGECLAVIDLDTVMPGFVAHDFGDAVRFAANPGGEDNPDLTKVYLDLDYYSAFAKGFVPAIKEIVTPRELETLPDGVLAITLELAARFLTDYLNGDVYFKCKMPKHNLLRTRAQIALAKDIVSKMPEMRSRLSEIV